MKINYAAVVVSALVYWVLGGLWYSPLLFGGKFIEIMRWSPEQLARIEAEGAGLQLALALVGSLVTVTFWHTSALTIVENRRRSKTGLWLWFALSDDN